MNKIGPLILILLFALVGGQISVKCKMPAVIGELIAGVILGPAVLNWVTPNLLVKSMSEIGVILLMFLAGLESDLAILKKLWYPSLLVAMVGMIVPIIVAYYTGVLFHFTQIECLFLGTTFAATSVSISVAVLQEMGRLKSKAGMTILGAAVVDDLLAVLLLSAITSIVGKQVGQGGVKIDFGTKLLLQVLYLLILIVGSFSFVPWLTKQFSKIALPAAEAFLTIIIIFIASFGAEYIGLSNVIGAFFVGLAFSQSREKAKLQHSFTNIGYSFFIPIFFTSIGLEMTLSGIWQNRLLFLILLVGAILSKLVGAGIGAKIAGFSNLSAFQVGVGMISRGEMALVVAQIGQQNHLLAPSVYSTVVGAIILTTIVTPFLLKYAFSRQR